MTKRADEPQSEKALRKAIIATARRMSESGLSPQRSGNVSARFGGGMLITPTGMAYDDLDAKDIVFVDADGGVMGVQRKPSSEWHFHLAAYAVRPDKHALEPTHSMYATVLACAHKAIPAFHYMVAVAGGEDIPCVPYATFGTDALAQYVAHGLKARDACLMANHGQVALGDTLTSALELAFEVETLAAQYHKTLLIGGVHLLPDAEMALMVEKFKTYGQKGQD